MGNEGVDSRLSLLYCFKTYNKRNGSISRIYKKKNVLRVEKKVFKVLAIFDDEDFLLNRKVGHSERYEYRDERWRE